MGAVVPTTSNENDQKTKNRNDYITVAPVRGAVEWGGSRFNFAFYGILFSTPRIRQMMMVASGWARNMNNTSKRFRGAGTAVTSMASTGKKWQLFGC